MLFLLVFFPFLFSNHRFVRYARYILKSEMSTVFLLVSHVFFYRRDEQTEEMNGSKPGLNLFKNEIFITRLFKS